jgi:hypothetical protein
MCGNSESRLQEWRNRLVKGTPSFQNVVQKNSTDVEEFANADCHAEPCAVLRAEPHADKFAEECAEVARGSGREKGNVR